MRTTLGSTSMSTAGGPTTLGPNAKIITSRPVSSISSTLQSLQYHDRKAIQTGPRPLTWHLSEHSLMAFPWLVAWSEGHSAAVTGCASAAKQLSWHLTPSSTFPFISPSQDSQSQITFANSSCHTGLAVRAFATPRHLPGQRLSSVSKVLPRL